jgi:hypothetical protein
MISQLCSVKTVLQRNKKDKKNDSYGQFHQHFISTFAPISLRQKSLIYTSSTKKALRETYIQKSCA